MRKKAKLADGVPLVRVCIARWDDQSNPAAAGYACLDEGIPEKEFC